MAGSRYELLPKALDHIEHIMTALHIVPVDPRDTPARSVAEQARFYMTPVRWRGHAVWFKASLRDAPGLTRGLIDEVKIQRAFADYEQTHRTAFDSPSYLNSGHHGPVYWLMRKYWSGSFGGEMTTSFGFSSAFVRAVTPVRLAAAAADVRRMTSFMRQRLTLERHDQGWYALDLNFYRRHFLRPALRHRLNLGWDQKTIRRIERVVADSKPFLREQARWFTHGDFYPNNMLITPPPGRRLVLFDWELAHENLPTFDSVMAWLMAWRYPRWQERFRRAARNRLPATPTTDRAWALATLSLGVRLGGFGFIRLTNSQPDRYPRLPARFRPTVRRMYNHMVRRINAALDVLDSTL